MLYGLWCPMGKYVPILAYFGHFSHFSCASGAEVVFLRFGPEPMLIMDLRLWVASMQKRKVHLPWESEIQFLE